MNTQVKKDVEDALVLINKAAREEKEELKQMMHEKYHEAKALFTAKLAQGTETVKHTAKVLDEKVRKNPWPYVAAAAAGAFLLGFVLHKSKHE
jgi:ElaB/YqjD/DUF883 family membrane-anchored ribosome-binding protein